MVIFVGLSSCKTRTTNENQTGHNALPEEKNQVEVMVIQRENFTREIISNGKLAAIQKAELYFENQGNSRIYQLPEWTDSTKRLRTGAPLKE